jgi:hypothetical protein
MLFISENAIQCAMLCCANGNICIRNNFCTHLKWFTWQNVWKNRWIPRSREWFRIYSRKWLFCFWRDWMIFDITIEYTKWIIWKTGRTLMFCSHLSLLGSHPLIKVSTLYETSNWGMIQTRLGLTHGAQFSGNVRGRRIFRNCPNTMMSWGQGGVRPERFLREVFE